MYRQIHTTILSEPWMESLSANARYLFLVLIIHPLTLPSGFLTITDNRLAYDMALSQSELGSARSELVKLESKIRFFPELSLWWIVNFHRWQGQGPKWLSHIKLSLLDLSPFQLDIFQSVFPNLIPTDTHTMPINRYGLPTDTHTMPTDGNGAQTPAQHNTTTTQQQQQQQQQHGPPFPPPNLENGVTATTTTTQDNDLATVCEVYENNIGLLTSITGDTLKEALSTYPAAWICDAIGLAVKAEKRNWLYCEAILKRWQNEGKNDGRKRQKTGKTELSDTESTYSRALRQATASQR